MPGTQMHTLLFFGVGQLAVANAARRADGGACREAADLHRTFPQMLKKDTSGCGVLSFLYLKPKQQENPKILQKEHFLSTIT